MSGSIIPTGGTVTLNTSLTGNITFSNSGTDSGVLLIEPGALSYGPSTTSVVQTYLGGSIDNFAPGDTIILSNLESDYANFDKAPSSISNNASFDSAILAVAGRGVDILVEPGNIITTNNPFVNSLYGAELQSLAGPYLSSIDEALFGASSLTATLTLKPTLEVNGTVVDAVITTSAPIIVPCFAAGTRILTPAGEVAVERLQPGDAVTTAAGPVRNVAWVGHRRLDFRKHPAPERAQPIRIAAGALAEGVPSRDLLLSPDHAVLIDGVLVQAKDLVDGVLITQERDCRQVTYVHVELSSHDILLANATPAESFLDTGHRGLLGDAGEPVVLHPDLMQVRRETRGCAKLATGGAALTAIRAGLAGRKRDLGHIVVEATPWLRAAGMILAPAARQTGELRFSLPPHSCDVELVLGSAAPCETDPASDDRRRLGIAISAIRLDGVSVPLEQAIAPGQRHPRAAGDAAVWTTGDVVISLPRAGAELVIVYAAINRRWSAPAVIEPRRRRRAARAIG